MKSHFKGLTTNLLSAASLALLANPVAAADIYNIDFDTSFPSSGSFGFAFAGYGPPSGGNVTVDDSIISATSVDPGIGVGASAALRNLSDTTNTEAAIVTPNNYSYMGFVIVTNHAISTPLPTSNLENYKLDLSLAAAGLKTGVVQANCLVDLRFFAPDDTVVPADDNSDPDLILSLRFPNAAIAKADFQVNSFRLNQTSQLRDGTTLDRFNTHFASVDSIQTNVEAGNGINTFGFDEGNAVILDNLVLSESPPPAPPAENPVVTIDYDVNPRSYGGSWYTFAQDGNAGSLPRTDVVGNSVGTLGTLGQENCIDTTNWAGTSNFLGIGNAAHVDLSAGLLPSPNLADYKVSIDVRSSGYINIPNSKLILELFAPDDTIVPADANSDSDTIVRLRFEGDSGFPMPTTYTTVTRSLTDATFDTGSAATFSANFAAVTGYRFVVETVANPNTDFGFDADNCSFMDNLKLIHLTPSNVPPVITSVVATAPNQFSITFESQAGYTYGIYRSIDLGDFAPIATVPATSATTTYTRNQALIGKEFFRVANLGPTPVP